MIVVLFILFLLLVLIGVIVVRTLRFQVKNEIKVSDQEESFDEKKAISNLAELVRCKTVSYHDKEMEDEEEFQKLLSKLPELYPHVFSVCEYLELGDRGILFHWKGKTTGNPAVLMAHYDVVPVDEELWDKPAFSAIIEDDVMWGRGTLDTKATMNGILTAADHMINQGFVPEQDIYFAFSGGEEINGLGAANIVDYFEKQKIELALVVDEGGAIVENIFPGVTKPCGLIGIAEKGMINVEYTCQSAGGHASAPKPHTPVGMLSEACCKIENHPFPSHLSKPVALMFDTLGRHSNFVFRMIFANLWLFSPVIDMLCRKQGGELNALMRTTVAFTQMEGSKAPNVIPPKATMISNIRLNPEDTIDSAMQYLKKVVDNDAIEIKNLHGMNPSRVSTTDCPGWEKLVTAVASTWKGCIVSPYLMVQCSDSRHYGRISDKVYRFSAMELTAEERGLIHGNNERIKLEAITKAVEFYIRLMRQL